MDWYVKDIFTYILCSRQKFLYARKDIGIKMSNKVAKCGIYISLAFIFSYLENIYSLNIGVPGIKLGLANLVVLIALYTQKDYKIPILISAIRIILAGFIFSNMYSIFYSMSGAILSLVIMIILKKIDKFSIKGVSMAGGVMHNIGQIIVAIFMFETKSLIYYMPVLVLAGMICGIINGILGNLVIVRLKNIID